MRQEVQNWLEGLQQPGRPDEFESKGLLRQYRIDVPRGVRVSPGEEPDTGTLEPPFVVKVCSPGIDHKTEVKGVMSQVAGNALLGAVDLLGSRFPDQPVLIEEQILFEGVECIVGALNDRQFGLAVMAGTGGILTELTRDAAFRLVPCSREEARRMLGELQIAPVFQEFRGLKQDGPQLAAIVSRLGGLAADLGPGFSSLDINPIVFSLGRWIALDARIDLDSK
ncbi:MAG: acetate--CoA ligase family protein [Desulfohalobiaceae bacterium]|nr:acetate--CoA ligase family protein [Desulfohalobiaceae bacterium]